jgi:PTS system nitrogen regulatory IIA component
MRLGDLLTEELVLAGFAAKDKWEAIDRMVGRLVESGRLRAESSRTAIDALVAREKIASTGVDHGIALPHAKIEGIDSALAVLATAPAGVPFLASDGKPSTILVLLLIPLTAHAQHVKTLSNIARLLGFEEVRTGLLGAKSGREALQVIRTHES